MSFAPYKEDIIEKNAQTWHSQIQTKLTQQEFQNKLLAEQRGKGQQSKENQAIINSIPTAFMKHLPTNHAIIPLNL